MRNFIALLAASVVHAQQVLELDYLCDATGHKVCQASGDECGRGTYFDEKACMCMIMMKCRIECSGGMQLDPRETCKCVDKEVVNSLSTCAAI